MINNLTKIILESLIVGINCVILFYVINFFNINFYTKVFIMGFFKHLFGYLLGLQNYYCSCNIINKYIILESLLEGLIFLLLSFIIIINVDFDNKFILIFLLVFITHIIAEMSGIHTYYCNSYCKL